MEMAYTPLFLLETLAYTPSFLGKRWRTRHLSFPEKQWHLRHCFDFAHRSSERCRSGESIAVVFDERTHLR
jgi:hypothetical protein